MTLFPEHGKEVSSILLRPFIQNRADGSRRISKATTHPSNRHRATGSCFSPPTSGRTFSSTTIEVPVSTSDAPLSWSKEHSNPHANLDENVDPSKWGYTEKLAFFFKEINQSPKTLEEVEALFVQMSEAGITPEVTIYTSIINLCIKHEELDRAERWFQRMKEVNVAPNDYTYGCMVSLGAKANDVDLIEHYWGEYLNSGLQISDKMFSILINSFAKAHAGERAVHWFREAVSVVEEISPIHLQGALKGIVHDGRRAGSGEVAEELASVLVNAGVKLDNICRNYMIKIWGREKNVENIRKWFTAQCVEEPNSHTYAITVQALCEADNLSAAEEIALQMEDTIGPNGVVFNTLITMAGKKGNYDLCKKWATRRLEAQFVPDAYTYFGLMLGAAHSGHIDEMVNILEKMSKPSEKHLSFAILELVRRGDLRALDYETQLKQMGGKVTHSAVPLLKSMRDHNPDYEHPF